MPTNTYSYIYEERGVDIRALYDGLAGISIDGDITDNAYIDIRSVSVKPTGGESSTQTGTRELYRITDMAIDSLSVPMSALKYDTNSANLPSQVEGYATPLSVTTTDKIRTRCDCPGFVYTTAISSQMAWLQGRYNPKYQLQASDFIRTDLADGFIQPIVLREGQGIAIVQSAFGKSHADAMRIEVREQTTGAVYVYRSRDVGTPGRLTRPIVALMNNTGSGVILEVLSIEMILDGETSDPQFRLAYINGGLDYEQGSCVKSDTDNPDLPEHIRFLRGPFVARLGGEENGIPTDWYTNPGLFQTVAQQHSRGRIRQKQLGPRGFDASSNNAWWYSWQWLLYQAPTTQPGLIINPGEGIGLLAGREGTILSSIFMYYTVEIQFNYIVTTTSGGSGTSSFAFAS